MASVERRAMRSPTPSQSDSIRDGPVSRGNNQAYQRRSSILDEDDRDDNDYEEAPDGNGRPSVSDRPPPRSEDQYIAALRHRFPNRPKNDYVYTKPPGPLNPPGPPAPPTTQPTPARTTPPRTPAITTPSTSGPYQSTSRTTNVNPDASGDRGLPRPALRRVDPDQQNSYARRLTNDTPGTGPQPKPITPGLNVRINDPNADPNLPNTSTFTRPSGMPGRGESIFESVPSHGGPVSYLGTGTFSQFEHCLRQCLERERLQTGFASQIIRQDFPPNMSTQDYGYPPTSTIPAYPLASTAPAYPPTSTLPAYPLLHSSSDHMIDYPSRPASMFGLDDIRHINVALNRSGIPLFPYDQPFNHSYPSPISLPNTTIDSSYPSGRRIIGEVVSACRLVEEDAPSMFDRHRSEAVQNVWSALRNHQPFSYTDQSRSIISPRGPYDI